MTFPVYDLNEHYEVTFVSPGAPNLAEVAKAYSGEKCTWAIEDGGLVFKRPMGSRLTPSYKNKDLGNANTEDQ